MRISHKHKFVFISVPKTGSTSARMSLDEYSDIISVGCSSPYQHHTSATKLKKHFKEVGWNWDEYFKFAFFRNPWDRMVSIYKYLENAHRSHQDFAVDYLKGTKSFKDYIVNGNHYGLQVDFLRDISNFYIGKFENLQEDFNFVCDKIGIPRQQLPHKNKSKHKHYTEYYDDETRQIVAKKYAKDIEHFGYKFGGNHDGHGN
jgi:hypothetical protein